MAVTIAGIKTIVTLEDVRRQAARIAELEGTVASLRNELQAYKEMTVAEVTPAEGEALKV